MVANVLQIAPQGKGKKIKKSPLTQDVVQNEKIKNKKNTQFALLLNAKRGRTLQENLSSQQDHSSPKVKMREKQEELKISKDHPKTKNQNTQEVQSLAQELILPLYKTHQNQNSEALQQSKKSKSSSRVASQIMHNTQQKTHQSIHDQLTFKSKNTQNKLLTPLREALQVQNKDNHKKTLGDVAKLAHTLNPTKISMLKSPQQEVSQDLAPKMNKTKKIEKNLFTQSLTSKEKTKGARDLESLKVDNKQVLQEIPSAGIQEIPKESKLKDVGLGELLKVALKEKSETVEEKTVVEEKKNEKSQDLFAHELKRETQFKIASSKESLMQFSQRIREEVLNYKPPFSKLTMELNPVELGKLEITITKKGRDLIVNVNANNANALQAFVQNQNEFRATLSDVGFSNVELNFSQGEGRGNGGQEREQKKRNKNGLQENITEIPALASMEIKMVQYA